MLETIAELGAIHRNGEITKRAYEDACTNFQTLIVTFAMNDSNFRYLQTDADRIGDAVQVVREHGLRAGTHLSLPWLFHCAIST